MEYRGVTIEAEQNGFTGLWGASFQLPGKDGCHTGYFAGAARTAVNEARRSVDRALDVELELGGLTHPEAFEASLPWDFFVDDEYVCRLCGERFPGEHEEEFVGHVLEMHADEALESGHVVIDDWGWDVASLELAAAFAA